MIHYRAKFILFFIWLVPSILPAQPQKALWEAMDSHSRISEQWQGIPVNRKKLNRDMLVHVLSDIDRNGSSTISIPHPSGAETQFDIQPSNLLSREVQNRHPEIQTFKGFNKSGELVRMNWTTDGLHAMIFSKDGTIYLDPMSHERDEYVSYFEADYRSAHKDGYQPACGSNDILSEDNQIDHNGRLLNTTFQKGQVGDQFKKYRLALVVKSNFTNERGGGNVNTAFNKVLSIVDRLTGIYESQLGITFELVTGTETVFSDSNPGPYVLSINRLTGNDNDRILAINYLNDDNNLGADNYDIGHVIAAGHQGGIASIGRVCQDNLKAGGMTTFPLGVDIEVILIRTFVHEIGHQFGALHTYSSVDAGCNGEFQINGAYEIGSGNTLMSYAGVCGDNNLQSLSDDYYHAISTQQVLAYTTTGDGKGCGVPVDQDNTPPVVSIRESGFVIPVNTPFVLEAEGSDEDLDDLTYNWQQFDQATAEENMQGTTEGGEPLSREEFIAAGFVDPNLADELIDLAYQAYLVDFEYAFRGDGPLFKNFKPTANNKRYFPGLELVLAGNTSSTEVMPFTSRALNFAISVSDGVGGTNNDLISFTSTTEAGPFQVTTEFSNPSYNGLSNITLNWDVANTNLAPVNCQKVAVLFSTDGGENFDITLLESTDNDGSETIRLPNLPTSEARIMVKAVDNIFFNVNDTDFSVSKSDVDIPEAPSTLAGIRENSTTIDLSWSDNSEVEDGFIIERQSESDTDFAEVARVAVNIQKYRDQNAAASELHTYRVAAFNATGSSNYTHSISIGQTASSATDILTFELTQQVGNTEIDDEAHTVSVNLAAGTDISALNPTLSLSDGATSTPANGQTADFTNPVTYTVTAEDGVTVQDWTVEVTVDQNVLAINKEKDWDIYPNPVNRILHIKTLEPVMVYLTDIFGRMVLGTKTGSHIELDLEGLSTGTYLLLMEYQGATNIQKVIKTSTEIN
ncbi:MAG: reprolysin-like metallopeptidase [Reichenbachiella sp.]|uniref:reprolysin-like metallopeptidase n=1 Tax=Reichenbachiella sp. TaxID=2184521 RepID=UPI003267970D